MSAKRPVIKLNSDLIKLYRYESLSEASRDVGTDKGTVKRAIEQGIQCKGFYWQYEVDSPVLRKKVMKKIQDGAGVDNSSENVKTSDHVFGNTENYSIKIEFNKIKKIFVGVPSEAEDKLWELAKLKVWAKDTLDYIMSQSIESRNVDVRMKTYKIATTRIAEIEKELEVYSTAKPKQETLQKSLVSEAEEGLENWDYSV